MASNSKRGKSTAAVPAMAAGVLLLVAGMIVAVLYLSKLKHDRTGGGSAEVEAVEGEEEASPFAKQEAPVEVVPIEVESAEPEVVDPFAGLDDPFAEPSKSTSTLVPEPGELTGSDQWQSAMKAAGRAPGQLMLATEAREQGRPADEKTYRRRAIAALNEALLSTNGWYETKVRTYDPTDLQVRSIVKLRQRWTDQLAKLRAEDAR